MNLICQFRLKMANSDLICLRVQRDLHAYVFCGLQLAEGGHGDENTVCTPFADGQTDR